MRRLGFCARGDFRRSRRLSTARSPESVVCHARVFHANLRRRGRDVERGGGEGITRRGSRRARELERARETRGEVRFHRLGRVRRPRVRTALRERVRGFEIGEMSRETRGRDGDERAEEVRVRASVRVLRPDVGVRGGECVVLARGGDRDDVRARFTQTHGREFGRCARGETVDDVHGAFSRVPGGAGGDQRPGDGFARDDGARTTKTVDRSRVRARRR